MASSTTTAADLLELLTPLQRWRGQQKSWVDPEAVEDRHLREMFAERRLRQEQKAAGLQAQVHAQVQPNPAADNLADRG